MTLVLTCATREVVVQVSDRRLTLPNGQLFDDNTTKAVCYCGRVAIGYTGVAKIQGSDTAEWIAKTLAPHDQLEPALAAVATSLAPIIGAQPIAIVASGWATLEEKNPRAFVCTVSNFQDEHGVWLQKARPEITRSLEWLDPGEPYLLSIAGQQLTANEQSSLDQEIRQALKEKNIPFGLAEALGEQVRRISDDGSERGKKVGKGLIVQALSRTAVERQLAEGEVLILTPLAAGANSAIYVAPEGSADEWESPWLVCGGGVMVGGGGPAGASRMSREIEQQRRSEPIVVPSGETSVRAECPFCRKEGKTTEIVAELPLEENERSIYCQEDVGHPLILIRGDSGTSS